MTSYSLILRKRTLAACVLGLPSFLSASSAQTVPSVLTLPQGVEIADRSARVRVVALSPDVIRVRYAVGGKFPEDRSFAALPGAFPNPPKVKSSSRQAK